MSDDADSFIIAIPIYEGVDFLDIAAPCEIFNWMGAVSDGRPVKIYLAATSTDAIKTRDGVQIIPHIAFADLPRIDLLFVPGGGKDGLPKAGLDPEYMNFLTSVGGAAEWITSVCEGALLLAKSGLLNGYKITTHWAFYSCFEMFPEVQLVTGEPPAPRYPSFVVDRNRVTGGGISSGLEECMELVKILAGPEKRDSVRKTIQYYPTAVEQDLGDPPPQCPFDLTGWA